MSGPRAMFEPKTFRDLGRFLPFMFGAGALASLRPGVAVRAADLGVKVAAGHFAMRDAYPALGPDHKLGIRYGGTGDVTTLAKAYPQSEFYGRAPRYIPWPDIGFGVTSVPVGSSRFIYESKKSESSFRTSSAIVRRKGGSGSTSRVTKRTTSSSTRRRRPKTIRRKGKRCPPGYRYDAKRKMCIQTFKR